MTHAVRFPPNRIFSTLTHVVGSVHPFIERFAFVGSYRRRTETCGDADLLIVPRSDHDLEEIGSLLRHIGGKTFEGGSDFIYIRLENTPVNVFITTSTCWGSALQYTTGSREHNIAVRSYAKNHGLLANQFGVFRNTGPGHDRGLLSGSSETESGFYRALGLRWVRPENRCRTKDGTGIIPLLDRTLRPSHRV